jgi:hypothetical protein
LKYKLTFIWKDHVQMPRKPVFLYYYYDYYNIYTVTKWNYLKLNWSQGNEHTKLNQFHYIKDRLCLCTRITKTADLICSIDVPQCDCSSQILTCELTTHFTDMCIPHFFLGSERRPSNAVRKREKNAECTYQWNA